MAKRIANLFKRMKVGSQYRRLVEQTYNELVHNQSKLIPGAKIKYFAQSTFHTIE